MATKIFTDSKIEIKELYTAQNSENISQDSLPGEFPFIRGIQPNMYRGKLWTMRQYAGFSTAAESNKRYKMLLEQGVTGLSVAFDLPTQIGYDCDHKMSHGEVGKVGVSICHSKDIEALFKDISLAQVSTSMTINATSFILLALYVALAKKQGTNLKSLSGTIQNDILKEYIARGTYIFPPQPSLKIITDIFEWCEDVVPRWNTISISGYHIREAGSDAVQEVAFTLSNGKEYVKAAMKKGLDINEFGKRLSFFFNAHNNLFEEVAKYRVARKIWAEIMKDFGATDPKAMMLRFHTQTGGATLTAQQPYNNISRVTIQSLAAVLGGTQSLHSNSFDEALGLPTVEAAQIALKIQQIIAYESGVTQTIDPLAGSYFVEDLCLKMEQKIKETIANIDKLGGSIAAIESGYFETEITNSAFSYQEKIENKEKIIVGVNEFVVNEESTIPILKINEEIQQTQIKMIQELRAQRDPIKVSEILIQLEQTAKENRNIMPDVLAAVEQQVTLGEIIQTLKNLYGSYKS